MMKKQQIKITVPEEISVGDLASLLRMTATEVIKELMKLGMMVTVNEIIDYETAEIVATELGAKVEKEVVISLEEQIIEEDEENEADCRARARAYATMELGKRIRRKSFSVAIDSADLGVAYNIGDVVSCVSVRFGVSFNARITGVKYKMDSNSTSTEIVLGDPILTALGEMKLNG